MKRILYFILAASLLFTSCGSLRSTPEEKKALAERVTRAVNTREMAIDITSVVNGRNSTISVNKEYSIELDGKHITTRLPFYGKTHYGGISELMGDASVVLTKAEIFNVGLDTSNFQRKGEYLLAFQAVGDNRTVYTFNITIFDNGQADILVAMKNKTSMRYYGELCFETRK
jgi:hypothetical protein